MATKVIKSSKSKSTTPTAPAKGAASKASTASKSEKTQEVKANERLVVALQTYDQSKKDTESYLVDVATIVQEEQLTKQEVIMSLVEARGCTPKTAGEQYSRMRGLLTNPKTLEELKNGVITLGEARAQTTKKQTNPNEEKKAKNAEQTMTRAVSTLLNKAKEMGTDLQSILNMIKAAAKKQGLK